ncbi:MAG: hypothetical protein QNL04_11290 [SAR324 cluster bacterium]|nr:hypothetical protein [SAR324 cluster bacterium]
MSMIQKLFILCTLFFILGASNLIAQVATPSLDPTMPSLTASGSAWRFGSTIGGSTVVGKEKTPTRSTADKTAAKGSSGIFAWQPTQVTIEMSGDVGLKDPYWDASSDEVTTLLTNEQKLFLAVRGDNRVSVGVGFREKSTDVSGIVRSESAYGGSMGFRIGEGIYVGGGLEKVVEKVPTYKDKRWSEVFSGIGIRYGWPDASMFRMEYSLASKGDGSNGDTFLELMPESKMAIGSIEAQFWGMMFGYQYTKESIDPILTDLTTRVKERARYGGGLRLLNFTMMLYKSDGKEYLNGQEHLSKDWEFTVGFHFI